jgi:hypothetical protein
MARLDFDGLGSHPLRHEAFEVRIDRAVFGRHGIVAGLRAPRGVRGLSGEERFLERLLDRIQDLGVRLRMPSMADDDVQLTCRFRPSQNGARSSRLRILRGPDIGSSSRISMLRGHL